MSVTYIQMLSIILIHEPWIQTKLADLGLYNLQYMNIGRGGSRISGIGILMYKGVGGSLC